MWQGLPIRPEQASTVAAGWDRLFYVLTGISFFFSVLIFVTVFYFAIRYRRRSQGEIPPATKENLPIELAWTIVPASLCVIIFLWATSLYISNSRPPEASAEIFVVGKQWMWKVQHPEGPREINELHVPVNRPIKLTMTSEDVIHDFGVPAFRIKKDVVPGIYTTEWFQATQMGKFHLFCDQYCGMGHTHMVGWIVVMAPDDYERWLNSQTQVESMAAAGARLFLQLGCETCHVSEGAGLGPPLRGLFGKQLKLQNGKIVVADDAFLRSAILNPMPVPGYPPIMPTFQGQLSEDEVLQIVAYIKSLAAMRERKGMK